MNRACKIIVIGAFLFAAISFAVEERYTKDIIITIDARHPTENTFPNIVSNINCWQLGNSFVDPKMEFPEYCVFDYVKWVQLMLCSGGSETRDLFKDPKNRENLTDYDFGLLIKNCEGILRLGAKPYLKLGAVPLKYTTAPKLNNYYAGFNIYPPDSYKQYYEYIKALIQALVDFFGKEEVLSWRFGCLVEYENGSHYRALNGKPEDSFIEYCKLYDYTAQALTEVLGNDVFIGAHSMSVLDGLWDERDFIEHAAKGRNYANGKIGTKLSSLSVSFYDNAPGSLSLRSLANTIQPLQEKARECGLNNLIYGVDEGRVLRGEKGKYSADLNSRATGYTWQAVEDARLFLQAIELGMDYFSVWNYLTGGNFNGYPTVSYHLARNIAKLEGYKKLNILSQVKEHEEGEIGCLAGIKNDTVRIMIYNFSMDIYSNKIDNIELEVYLPFKEKGIKIVKWLIDDDCNYFDEWIEDRKKYNISDSAFRWSPDDGEVEAVLIEPKSKEFYRNKLRQKYMLCSQLNPDTSIIKTRAGLYKKLCKLKRNNVFFLEVTKR